MRRKLTPDQTEIDAICIYRYFAIWPHRLFGMESSAGVYEFWRWSNKLYIDCQLSSAYRVPLETWFAVTLPQLLSNLPGYLSRNFNNFPSYASRLSSPTSGVLLLARGGVTLSHSLLVRAFFPSDFYPWHLFSPLNNSNNGMGPERERIQTFRMTSSGFQRHWRRCCRLYEDLNWSTDFTP